MGFREVPEFEVKEVLRLWLRDKALRAIERLARVDRKTVRRYVQEAGELGVDCGGGEGPLSDEVLSALLERVRPHRHSDHGESWRTLEGQRKQIRAWLEDQGLTLVKVHTALARQGVGGPPADPRAFLRRTMRAGSRPKEDRPRRRRCMGLMYDPDTDRRRVVHAVIFTPCLSRYSFVWLTFTLTLADILAGFEAVWEYFGGIFAVVIPENVPRNIFGQHVGRCAADDAKGPVERADHRAHGAIGEREDDPEAAPGQPGAEQHRLGTLDDGPVAEVVESQTRFGDPVHAGPDGLEGAASGRRPSWARCGHRGGRHRPSTTRRAGGSRAACGSWPAGAVASRSVPSTTRPRA